VVGLSKAANWGLQLTADHPDRVHGLVLVGASVTLTARSEERVRAAAAVVAAPADLPPSRVPEVRPDPPAHWVKYNGAYWRERFDDFAWFFLGQCFTESHSTKQIEDGVGWALQASGEVLTAEHDAAHCSGEQLL